MAGTGVDDVELRLVGGEGEPVRPHEVVGNDLDRPVGVDPEDVAPADLALGAVALVVRLDPVARVGEPDRAVRAFDDVVGTVEALSLPAVGKDRRRAVVLGPRDPASAVLARDDTTLAVDRAAVGVAGRLRERPTTPVVSSQRSVRSFGMSLNRRHLHAGE